MTGQSEWLVTDQYGAFAMGTPQGVRTRKYHGYYMGIAGRSETAFLADFELKLNGKPIWPPTTTFSFEQQKCGPVWRWEIPEGRLSFDVRGESGGGIRLNWQWQGARPSDLALLEIRPFCAFRPLHGLGGRSWTRGDLDAFSTYAGKLSWKDAPTWEHRFHYSEEAKRGYPADENLYSAGTFTVTLDSFQDSCSWRVGSIGKAIDAALQSQLCPPILDFVLHRPAGVVAGYPWFGEWGRDTFISLPGIVMAWIAAGGDSEEAWNWAEEVLLRWGEWIKLNGMIPNVIEKNGSHQWESADGTLWWCHTLAALWTFSLGKPALFQRLQERFSGLLTTAIDSIISGRHRLLSLDSSGLLVVTGPHSTWMDARLDNIAVTPRIGRLPEINALWFQARCLQWIWANEMKAHSAEIERLGKLALSCSEGDRPNNIFLHSIPLAPSFILKDWKTMTAHLEEMIETLWTPVGLRTLNPKNPAYRPACQGDQRTRDLAYHQGSPWAWLGGHYEMARSRVLEAESCSAPPQSFPAIGPIPGHVPELFDAETPFAPRGTPAQAWSLACFEEAKARRSGGIDSAVIRYLTEEAP